MGNEQEGDQVTDLQRLCLYALEDMTLVQLNAKYFDNLGIGWTKRLIAGKLRPMRFIEEMYEKRFEKIYQDKVAEWKRIDESSRGGW